MRSSEFFDFLKKSFFFLDFEVLDLVFILDEFKPPLFPLQEKSSPL